MKTNRDALHCPAKSALSIRKSLFLIGFCICLAGITNPAMSQNRLETQANARLTLHDETPEQCLGLIWWNHLTWDSVWQQAYTYAIDGKLIEMIHSTYQSGNLVPSSRQVMAYDGQGRLSERITQSRNAGTWANTSREFWTFDHLGNDTLSGTQAWHQFPTSVYGWDTTGGSRHRYTYRPDDQISIDEAAYWVAGNPAGHWVNSSRNTFFFNVLGQWDSMIVSSPFANSWVQSQRTVAVEWANYALGQKSAFRTQFYQGGWIESTRTTCTYTGLDSECYIESYSSGNWDTVMRAYKFFDAETHLVQSEEQEYASQFWHVTNGEKHHYVYDGQGHTSSIVDQLWDPSLQNYINAFQRVYTGYFTGAPTASELPLKVKIWPVPAKDVLHFESATASGPLTVDIFDLEGHRRASLVATVGQALDWSVPTSLENGIYCYAMRNRAGKVSGRFTVQR